MFAVDGYVDGAGGGVEEFLGSVAVVEVEVENRCFQT